METHHITFTEQQDNQNVGVNNQTASGSLDNMTTFYSDRIKNSQLRPKKLSDIIEQIRNPQPWLLESITDVRNTIDTTLRQEKKRNLLPYFCFQQFKGNKRSNKNFSETKYIILDLDHLGKILTDIKNQITLHKEAFVVFDSPSGDGLKVAYELEKTITSEDEFRNAFAHLKGKLEQKYHVSVDADDDPARACYLSYDPDIRVNLQREPQVIPANPTSPQKQPKPSQVPIALGGSASPGRTDAMCVLIGHLNQRGIEQEIALGLIQAWNKQHNNPPLPEKNVEVTISDMYARYQKQSSMRPASIVVQENCCFLVRGQGKETTKKILTNFVIIPKELLILDGSDCLFCTVVTNQNITYENITIENSDWHTKARLLKAIGHQDCSFFGSDTDVQTLCSHINMNMPVRKKGTKVIGLVENLWVAEGINISATGKSQNIMNVPYQKGADAFYHNIGYEDIDDNAYRSAMADLYLNITQLNNSETILPMIGWNFCTPLKPIIMDYTGSFPLMFIHGSQGSGKTSTAKLFMRMHGYKEDTPQMCDIKPFPMLKLLSSTNAIPVFLDEFKVKDMRQESVDNLLRFMRKSYDGEVERKGRQDQTVESYELQAPLVVMGEWSINQPAIKERIIFPRFSNIVKTSAKMQIAFQNIESIPLEAFMPRYIEFVLNLDIHHLYEVSNRYVKKQLKSKTVAPRIIHNLTVMILGLKLFLMYGKHLKVQTPQLKLKELISAQLKEITGTDSGLVRSAVDQLIEELGFMAQKNEREKVYVAGGQSSEILKSAWHTTVSINKNPSPVECVAIRFSKVFPDFKEYAKRTNYEGDLLDKESYMKMFDECEYIVAKSHNVDFDGKKYKALCIEIETAKKAGIDLEGFGIV